MFHEVCVRGQVGGVKRTIIRERGETCFFLYPPGEQKHHENNDKEAGTTADVMIAGTEAIAAAAKEQHNENNKEDVHGRRMNAEFVNSAFVNESEAVAKADVMTK